MEELDDEGIAGNAEASFDVEIRLEKEPSLVYREGKKLKPKVKKVELRKWNQSLSMITIDKKKKKRK